MNDKTKVKTNRMRIHETTVTKIVQYSLLTMEDTLQHPVAYPGNCVE